ncbi:MAG: Rieske 2Fe-2S domain-containing protein [Hyphomicrobiales bacterium]|nr:Rieske 2Fe-2S domain-containing protein [Hyphomicrobiales bacterium]
MQTAASRQQTQAKWQKAISLAELEERSKAIVKLDGKQILVLLSAGRIYAFNNRCPHEGFPLAEGTLSEGCILTCNWHSWRFNLEDGETLVGGDTLRHYPHDIRDGDIWLDVSDPPPEALRARALAGLREAFDEHDYERIARELARFERADGDPLDALTHALEWAMDGLEFGTTHAQAAAPDWLALRSAIASDDAAERLIPVVEIIGHLSWDVLMQKGPFPIPADEAERFDADVFEQAIEDENEALALAQARAGLRAGGGQSLRASLERASLRHYQNFGHSVIYLDKAYELAGILGDRADAALLLPLVRSLCQTAREDLIPEFRAYGPALAAWDSTGMDAPDAGSFRGKGVDASLKLVRASSGQRQALYDALMCAAADAMLHYDASYREQTTKPVQENIDWLDFTHAITHLNAARKVCAHQPELWANALLQTGCFLGRNAKFVDWEQETSQWSATDNDQLVDDVLASMLDHGEPLYIFPAHTLKVATALKEELALNPDAPWKPVALAALNRFVNEPMKKKHVRRAVAQASRFVELEG